LFATRHLEDVEEAGPAAMLAPRKLFQCPGRIFRIILVTYGRIAQLIHCAPIVRNVGPTRRRPIPPDTLLPGQTSLVEGNNSGIPKPA
jgi:hypothetical protein